LRGCRHNSRRNARCLGQADNGVRCWQISALNGQFDSGKRLRSHCGCGVGVGIITVFVSANSVEPVDRKEHLGFLFVGGQELHGDWLEPKVSSCFSERLRGELKIGAAGDGGSIVRFDGTLGHISRVTVEIEEEFDSVLRIPLKVVSPDHMSLVAQVRNVVNGIHLDRISASMVTMGRELVNGACFIWTLDHVFTLNGHSGKSGL